MKNQTGSLELNTDLIQISYLRESLLETLNFLKQLMPTKGEYSIVLWNSETETFDVGASTVEQQPLSMTEKRVRRQKGASRWIVDQQQPLIVNDVRQDPFGANSMLLEYGIQTYCGVPLIYEDIAIGVLYSLRFTQKIYDANAIEFLKSFANFITITVANIRLNHQLVEANQRIQEGHNKLQAIFDTLPHKIFIKDVKGCFTKINKWSIPEYGVSSSEEVIGKTDFDFFPEKLARQFYEDEQNIIQTGEALVNHEETNIREDGQLDWRLTTKIPLFDANGEIVGIVGSSRSITSRKLVERQRQQLEIEQQQVEILNSFIGNVAHDFKTPLSVINTSLYLLKREHGELIGTRLNTVESQTKRLSKLVDDMLEMSKLDTIETLEVVSTNIGKLIEDIIARPELKSVTSLRNSVLHTQDKPLIALVAPKELALALYKIIENAVRHNPEQTDISILMARIEDEVHITISDTGVGISEEEISKIFDRFYRVDRSRNFTTGGTGLGLAIAQKYIDLHQGRIEVESEVGYGSQFKVCLPLKS